MDEKLKSTRKLRRRSPEEVKRDEKFRDVVASKVQQVVSKNWDDIRDADGKVNIAVQIDGEKNSATVGLTFLKQVEVEHEFILDDGQEELKPAAGGGDTSASA